MCIYASRCPHVLPLLVHFYRTNDICEGNNNARRNVYRDCSGSERADIAVGVNAEVNAGKHSAFLDRQSGWVHQRAPIIREPTIAHIE